ncbi:Fibronectin type III domain protein [Bacillus mycoides]|uniref:Fibronectin type III domain protein n=2 Tax=Bacillus mycoides TaxID=1405 RepID=A0A1E8BNB2_BACMY|nr:Fibronectin type III domain protein [Bacillus mycoides]OFE01042.1 Fibronectin type III domain protein [Bacillus mycoides]OHX31592.1 Fibronectin type III domain protein [Bacillus mycoides]
MERIEKERMIYMQKKNNFMFKKPMKVLATSAILATTLFTPTITNSLTVQAETQEETVKKQVSTEHVFQVMGKGNVDQIKDKDRRQFRFSPYEPTGLYANPNEKITILVEGTQNIQAYIGTFSYDAAWNQDSLIKSFTLKPGENTIESPNGGMIYFYNPQQGGTVQAAIKTGGESTPFFELGKHTKQDLVNMLDTYPNGHAVELKGERALITASPERVKKYLLGSNTDPVELLKKIDEAIRIEDRVSGLSEEEADKHYVHFVEDNHSKDYYMYAYPNRTAYVGDAIQNVLDINKFTKDGWGPWHEMGHQRQQTPWLWDGLMEVTTNIYSMSVQRAFGHPSRLENGTYEKAFAYLNKPQSEKDYNKIDDVFVKVAMFWQLDLVFGEEFYPKLHQLYRSIPKEELPKTSDEKIQGFIYNTSKVAKQNLLPFFDQWGLKASQETRQKVEALNNPTLIAPLWEATDAKPVKPLAILSKKIMKASANSEESWHDPASNAIDDNPNTIWHSKWSTKNQYPYNLTLDLGGTKTITQVACLPRQDGSNNGRILNYNIYTSMDGSNYQKVTSGTWESNRGKEFATFEPVSAKYVKVEVTNGKNGYASIAEVDVLTDSSPVKP